MFLSRSAIWSNANLEKVLITSRLSSCQVGWTAWGIVLHLIIQTLCLQLSQGKVPIVWGGTKDMLFWVAAFHWAANSSLSSDSNCFRARVSVQWKSMPFPLLPVLGSTTQRLKTMPSPKWKSYLGVGGMGMEPQWITGHVCIYILPFLYTRRPASHSLKAVGIGRLTINHGVLVFFQMGFLQVLLVSISE